MRISISFALVLCLLSVAAKSAFSESGVEYVPSVKEEFQMRFLEKLLGSLSNQKSNRPAEGRPKNENYSRPEPKQMQTDWRDFTRVEETYYSGIFSGPDLGQCGLFTKGNTVNPVVDPDVNKLLEISSELDKCYYKLIFTMVYSVWSDSKGGQHFQGFQYLFRAEKATHHPHQYSVLDRKDDPDFISSLLKNHLNVTKQVLKLLTERLREKARVAMEKKGLAPEKIAAKLDELESKYFLALRELAQKESATFSKSVTGVVIFRVMYFDDEDFFHAYSEKDARTLHVIKFKVAGMPHGVMLGYPQSLFSGDLLRLCLNEIAAL